MTKPENDRPQIVVDQDADVAIGRRIQAIDRSIHRSPEAFEAALGSLGHLATEDVVSLADIDTIVPTATRKPDALTKEFLGNRYDLASEYDEATEAALAKDPQYQKLLATVRSKGSITVRKGKMSSQTRANPEADAARDAFRRYRFGAYLARVIEHKKAEAPSSDLSSAV
jgi:hypothetical protein